MNNNYDKNIGKDKQYVEFYDYWFYQYSVRNFLREFNKSMDNPLDNFSEIALSIRAKYNIVNELDQRMIIANKIFRELFKNHAIHVFGNSVILNDNVSNDDSELLQIAFDSSSEMIVDLANKKKLTRNRKIKSENTGLKILGISGGYIDNSGHILGKIIAEIDLTMPSSTILKQLDFIKAQEFKTITQSINITVDDIQKGIAARRYEISANENAKFRINDEKRAFGLYIWDTINSGFTPDLPTLIKLIEREKVEGYEFISNQCDFDLPFTYAVNDEVAKEFPDDIIIVKKITDEINVKKGSQYAYIPEKKVLGLLGIDVSDDRSLRRLYQITRECIDRCEVLPITS